uniref:Cohesin loading complex subunit SCC4 homolog n=1 Tax=Tetranychus urticae TaxID=32264 RepID=T1K301_TETUR
MSCLLHFIARISPDNIPVAIRLGQLLMESEMKSKGIEKFIQLNQMTIHTRGNLDLSLAVGSILLETRERNTLLLLAVLSLLSLQLRQFASGFHYFKTACALCKASSANVIFSLLAVSLESLSDDINARQAHITAIRGLEKMTVFSPIPLINYAVYLYNKDKSECKEMIMELLMTLEQFWLNRIFHEDCNAIINFIEH